MGEYLRNFSGTVCAISPQGDHESSYCGGVFDGDYEAMGDPKDKATGPVTCPECIAIIKEIRADLKTVRLSQKVRP